MTLLSKPIPATAVKMHIAPSRSVQWACEEKNYKIPWIFRHCHGIWALKKNWKFPGFLETVLFLTGSWKRETCMRKATTTSRQSTTDTWFDLIWRTLHTICHISKHHRHLNNNTWRTLLFSFFYTKWPFFCVLFCVCFMFVLCLSHF